MNKLKIVFLIFGVLSVVVGCAQKSGNLSVNQTDRGVELSMVDSILFDSGKYELKPEAATVMDDVATILKDRSQKNILVEGHTDNVGSAQYNQKLSEQRAESVKQALANRGVPVARMTAVGYGMNRPIADNATPEGRQRNRRTQVILEGELKENVEEGGIKGFFRRLFGGK